MFNFLCGRCLRSGALHTNSPRYLAEHVTAYVPYRSLRSVDKALVVDLTSNLRPNSFFMRKTLNLELASI